MLCWNCAIVADVMLELKLDDWSNDLHHLRRGIHHQLLKLPDRKYRMILYRVPEMSAREKTLSIRQGTRYEVQGLTLRTSFCFPTLRDEKSEEETCYVLCPACYSEFSSPLPGIPWCNGFSTPSSYIRSFSSFYPACMYRHQTAQTAETDRIQQRRGSIQDSDSGRIS